MGKLKRTPVSEQQCGLLAHDILSCQTHLNISGQDALLLSTPGSKIIIVDKFGILTKTVYESTITFISSFFKPAT